MKNKRTRMFSFFHRGFPCGYSPFSNQAFDDRRRIPCVCNSSYSFIPVCKIRSLKEMREDIERRISANMQTKASLDVYEG